VLQHISFSLSVCLCVLTSVNETAIMKTGFMVTEYGSEGGLKMKGDTRKPSIVLGALLIIFGVLALLQTFTDISVWVWIAVLGVAGLGVFVVYLSDRSLKVLLIPVYVLWVVAIFLVLLELNILQDAFVATFVLAAIAIPFIVAFLQNRAQWGFLIPAYVLLAIGLMVPLLESGMLTDLLVPAYVMFVIAIPFLAVFLLNREHWWALIPGGILLIIGFAFLFAEAAVELIIPAVLILVGIGILLRQFLRREPEKGDAGVEKHPER
jgi:hypothetical protein